MSPKVGGMSQTKVKKLTPAQEALIPVYREKWRAIALITDSDCRLHAEGKPAVQFADGFSIYAYRGVILPEWYDRLIANTLALHLMVGPDSLSPATVAVLDKPSPVSVRSHFWTCLV